MKGGRKWVETALSVPSMEVFCLGFVANHFDVMPARTNDMSLSHNGTPPRATAAVAKGETIYRFAVASVADACA